MLSVLLPAVHLRRSRSSSLGIYVASALFIALLHGAPRQARAGCMTAAGGARRAAVLFMMFEVWFKVPLPKGPLEALLGLLTWERRRMERDSRRVT
ncbi:MAG: hypothetical protein MZW92_64430 [Comamonadaceae bacterium]|nr:hypothetical protein [Comamonadaceae bacterium]